jgi:GNAT superfamily N-acetyltransferase
MPYEIVEAKTDEEILACWPVIQVLRPHVIKDTLVDRIKQQHTEGYHLLCIKEDSSTVVSILGYRIQNFLWSGKTLYIDDFCTLPTVKGKGYGGALINYIIEYAKDQKCNAVSLDSGYTRNDAHRLYLNKRFELASHHFHMSIKQ